MKKKKIWNKKNLPLDIAKAENFGMLILALSSGICGILQIYAVSGFVNVALESIHKSLLNRHLLGTLFLLLLTVAMDWLAPRFSGILRQKAELKLVRQYRPRMLKKCASLQYIHVEQADSLDLIERVLKEPEKNWQDIYQAILALLKLFINIIGILIVIAGYVWWAAGIILLFCIPLFTFSVKGGKKNYQTQRDTSCYSRKYWYLDYVLNSRECLNERKIFGYTEKVNKQYADTYQEAFGIETKMQAFWAVKTKLSGGLSAIAALLIVITLIQPTLSGKISIGLFISLVNVVFSLTSQMSWGLSRNIDALVKGNEFCRDMRDFWNLEEEEGILDAPKYMNEIKKIEFKNVSFRYPGTDYLVLEQVSFRLNWGQNYAFVGANGAGKTTIIKLLTGLYKGYQGEIRINGKELRSYSPAEQKGIFSVVYQDFYRHALSFRENCEISDPCHNLSEEEMKKLTRQFDLQQTIENFPEGYDTLLGKIRKGGMDLSGGEWQKMAMLRALLRPAKVRILDEPTASLDPKMESEIYQLFQQMTKDSLTILISHRLGFAKLADQILVFEKGRICEQGDFEKLMEKKGIFYKMYEEQRSWYQ
ncbi:MAG: ABC transporter ATP-binding protein [Clostridiales bacterium]|nr:ABC transporter ATP-binding protein [Clostridiales bacterium]